jgi:hydrogenase-4 component F
MHVIAGAALIVGLLACAAIGVTTGPLNPLLSLAADLLAGTP